jgi:hypothetical protein
MKSRTAWILLICLFFVAGAAGSYLFLKHFTPAASTPPLDEHPLQSSEGDFIEVRLLLPKNGKLELVPRKLRNRTKSIAFAESVMEEFFSAAGREYSLPPNVKVLGLYRDMSQMLYIDCSDELRRNFQGDALDEYLLLKGMYETLVSNVQDFQDLKVLVEGREIETLGGHFFLKFPLRSIVLPEPKAEAATDHD